MQHSFSELAFFSGCDVNTLPSSFVSSGQSTIVHLFSNKHWFNTVCGPLNLIHFGLDGVYLRQATIGVECSDLVSQAVGPNQLNASSSSARPFFPLAAPLAPHMDAAVYPNLLSLNRYPVHRVHRACLQPTLRLERDVCCLVWAVRPPSEQINE